MKIDITITMGEDSKIMSLEEAKGLYNELGKLFGNRNVSTGSVENKISRSPERRPTGEIISEQNTSPDVPEGNPRVEAAKNRAASRTAGCGSSRTKSSGCGTR